MLFANKEKIEELLSKKEEANEAFSDWYKVEAAIDPTHKRGGFARVLSGLFAIWAILAFLYAELEWDSVNPKDGMIGVGASAYSIVLFSRAIALACVSAALAILSHGDLILRGLRLSYRSVFPSQ